MPSVALQPLQTRRAPSPVRFGGRARASVISLLAFAGVMAGVYAATRPEPVDAGAAIASARAALAAGNGGAAIGAAQAALRSDPRSAGAELLLARAYLEAEQGAPAEAALVRARELGMPERGSRHLLAHARLLAGDARGALEALEGATDTRYAARVRARALAMLGRRGDAAAVLEAAVRAAPDDARSWAELGRSRFSGGEVGLADAAATRAAALAPGDPVALTLKGELVRSRFGPAASLPWFEAALKRDARHYPALIEYAATLGEVGRYRAMLAAAREAALARPGSAEPLYLQAVLAARAGNWALARSVLDAAGPGADAMPGPALLRGAIDYADGAFEQAAERWRALLRVQPMNLRVRSLLAAALLRSGAARDAAAVLAPVVERGDADLYSLTLAARAWEAAGDRGRAAGLLDRAARSGRGAAGVFAAADRAAAQSAAPGDPTYAVGLIRGLAGTGDRGAVPAARALVAATPGAPDAQTALGDAYAAQGRWVDAAPAYRRAADLRFDEPAMLRFVDALVRVGRAGEAAGVLSVYLAQNGQSLVARRLLGRLQLAGGDADAAIETLESLRARLGATDAGLLAELASAYAADGDGAVATRYAAAAYALAPMNAGVVAAYAEALGAAGNLDGARQMRSKLGRLR